MIDIALLSDMYYAAPELWYICGAVMFLLLMILIGQLFKILRLKQKNYFLNRDRERYAETLYASKDGYFAFIYPDQKVNDPRKKIVERCSRRLAIILNLPKGTKSAFEDILKNFYKDDIKKILKYVSLLREDGVSFDDDFALKNNNKFLRLSGSRISGSDGNVYCDMIWFRDVSFETGKITKLEEEKKQAGDKQRQLEDLIDNIPFPIWLRDNNLKLRRFNKKYEEFLEQKAENPEDNEITNSNGDNISQELAKIAHTTNKAKTGVVNVVKGGQRLVMEVFESPFHEDLDKICTAGALIDITELDDLKRNLKLHQNAQLEILGTLGTAFAVFNEKLKLAFYNKSFAGLWNLDEAWLENTPSYSMFLDIIREKRLLPEVPDYTLLKNDEQKEFSRIIEPKEDMLHLPNGKTLRRVRAPHPMGGLIFAYEDISDRLEATSAYNALLSIQSEMLNNLFDAVIIIGNDGHLKFYNQAYIKLWNASKKLLDTEPSLEELIEAQKQFFSHDENWKELKEDIISHLFDMTTKSFILNRNEIDDVEVSSTKLSDGSIMITYQKIIA